MRSNTSQGNFLEDQDVSSETLKDIGHVGVALSTSETVNRYGSANAEYIKGYTGVDNETGQVFDRSLKKISGYKVSSDPYKAENNIKQQAGFSAEVAATSRDNAEAIIEGSPVRTSRSEDVQHYGKNHKVVDRVQILDGNIIEGSQAQMKFVGNRDQLFKDITKPDGKFARYRGVKLELPSEQYEGAVEHCKQQAKELRARAHRATTPEASQRLKEQADYYDQLADNITDSGLTTEDALFYRKHPKIATALDITRTSHRAGIEGAKYGAIIGGTISLLSNAFCVAQEKKQLDQAAFGIANDTVKAAALGYGTAFAGSSLKSCMQQSGNQTLRMLSGTSAPTLAVNICLSLGSSVKRYVSGELTEAQLLTEVGEKGAGMLSSAMMAALGQIAIPVPFVGAAVGGMIGYTLSSFFYQSALVAARDVELSREQLTRVRLIEIAARERIAEEQAALESFTSRELPQLREETELLYSAVRSVNSSADELAAAINNFATLLGKKLQFQTLSEFDDFMSSDQPLTL
jgi:hypothetical protein